MLEEKRILLVGPAWVGDMVMAQTLFKVLKQRHPEHRLEVLAPGWTKPLLNRMQEVSESLDLPFTHGELRLRDRYRLAHSLRSRQYEQAIVLPNSYKSALIPFWANIPRRTGWLGEMRYGLLNDIRRLNKANFPLMIQRFMALALAKDEDLPQVYPYPELKISPESVADTLRRLQLTPSDRPILALCPGAEFGSSKRWPPEYFAEVANAKISKGWSVWLLGSHSDKAIADQIDTLTDHRTLNLAGSTSLTDAIDLLSLATVVVTNDSGLMHVAAALNRPVVAVYGSTSPKFTPPLSERVKVLRLELPCSPCFQRECPLKHFKCMIDLKPDLILSAISDVANSRQTSV